MAIVCGGASGIGAGCVRSLARDGYAVVIMDLPRQEKRAQRVIASLPSGSTCHFVAANAMVSTEVEIAVEKANTLVGVPAPDVVVVGLVCYAMLCLALERGGGRDGLDRLDFCRVGMETR